MIISTSQKLRHQTTSTLNVKIGTNCIENENVYKILGICVDSKLTWSDQIKNIARKVNNGINPLRRIRKLIPVSYRVIFSDVWGGGRSFLGGALLAHNLPELEPRNSQIVEENPVWKYIE